MRKPVLMRRISNATSIQSRGVNATRFSSYFQMSLILKNLMQRLGFDKFYAQGGDWGSAITAHLGGLYPDKYVPPTNGSYDNSRRFNARENKWIREYNDRSLSASSVPI